MSSDPSSRYMRLKAEIANAGGFGDGVDTSAYDVASELGNSSYSHPERVEVSIALLAELASAIDNSDWESVRTSKLARAARTAVAQGWLNDQLLAAAVRALDETEQSFFKALTAVFAAYLQTTGDSSHANA